jgi:hypothetical protein
MSTSREDFPANGAIQVRPWMFRLLVEKTARDDYCAKSPDPETAVALSKERRTQRRSNPTACRELRIFHETTVQVTLLFILRELFVLRG